MNNEELELWLASALPLHQRLKGMVVQLITQLIVQNEIEYLSINGRVKEKASIIEKIKRKSYDVPSQSMTDITGVRIVSYLQRDVEKICKLIDSCFRVDKSNSLDRAAILGDDKIGYRSVHFVCTIGSERSRLPEFSGLDGLKFEIQVRTVLQHAWAELTHDRSYKSGVVLPKGFQRQINLYSGMLELVDGAFNNIAENIDEYGRKFNSNTIDNSEEDESIGKTHIDSINIKQTIDAYFLKDRFEFDGIVDESIVGELKRFGVRRISEFRNLIKKNMSYLSDTSFDETYIGMIRNFMMLEDIDKYFERAWRRAWTGCSSRDLARLSQKYGSDKMGKIEERYGLIELD